MILYCDSSALVKLYADAFALRGYDSVQLAAAKLASETIGEPCGFACFDDRLDKAARLLGLALVA